ncbi:sigma-54-dependent Fis family transcriptional regulator [uncultured Roseibium sp.]|uniref:sigma-54-dependent Fis family transcriptional regulator n=1 Tax=uncultured Roseibium sp. TaxID=1936171 RepID=UPI0026018F28|nr:sigma-54-dependent Fis family transcriptional regulator [uncultured Roseibium sp.]
MPTSYFTTQNQASFRKRRISSIGAERQTMRSWEQYVEGRLDTNDIERGLAGVRPEILKSWDRSKGLGISALSQGSPKKLTAENINSLTQKNQTLVTAAKSAFARLSPHLAESGAILILTDKNGTIIEAIGDPQTIDAGRDIKLEIGGVWAEGVIGTNGIGTALSTGTPAYVHASEHFCLGIKAWTCAAAPIFDPLDKSIAGVLDLSGPPAIFRPHNLALVVAAAREIEIALAEGLREERTILLEALIDSSATHSSTDGIVLLNRAGRIVYNRNTDRIPSRRKQEFMIGRKLLAMNPEMTGGQLAQAIPRELTIKGVELLKSGGETRGAVVILPGQSASREPLTKHRSIKIAPRTGVEEDEIEIVGNCPKMLEAIDFARRAAEANVTVLVQGETGVGKELFARLIHSHHKKKNAPYVAVNCAAISNDLIGGELFGHVAGAFTGALREGKVGKFELANGGVICLDEIGDMPLELQSYLLRTLEQRAVYRIGCNTRRAIDVQLVAMTNRNLRHDIEEGNFRRDLFYRISAIVIEVPPLRERGDDIFLLIDQFNRTLSRKFGRSPLVFDDSARTALSTYRWPGNVRELRNTIERLCLLSTSERISMWDLPSDITSPDDDLILPGGRAAVPADQLNLDDIESIAIQRAIELENGNLSKVAASLGISRPTLYRKIKLYGLDRGK